MTRKVKSEIIKLTQEEIKMIAKLQDAIDQEKVNLGNLRLQFLLSERRIIGNVEKVQGEFYSHLQELSKQKEIPTSGEWFFDPTAYVFRKKT